MPSTTGSVFFVLWGAVLVFSMHGGFAFLEAGSVRRKNVADSLTRIITDWAISTVMYFAIGWPIAYGTWMYASAAGLVSANQGFNLVHFLAARRPRPSGLGRKRAFLAFIGMHSRSRQDVAPLDNTWR